MLFKIATTTIMVKASISGSQMTNSPLLHIVIVCKTQTLCIKLQNNFSYTSSDVKS